MDKVRNELIQVAAVAVAILTDMEQGDTTLAFSAIRASAVHYEVMQEVYKERVRQEAKWGAQHHSLPEWLIILGEEFGEACQAVVDQIGLSQRGKC